VRGYGQGLDQFRRGGEPGRGYNGLCTDGVRTAWYYPPVVFARNDGNLTRMEVLLGVGVMQGVLAVLVNGYQIPLWCERAEHDRTGWYNIPTLGTRDGAFDLNS